MPFGVCKAGVMRIVTNNTEHGDLDELFQKTFDFLKEKDPKLLDDISKAADSNNRDLDFVLGVAVRIHMAASLLGFSEEIQFYLRKIQIGFLFKCEDLYPKEASHYKLDFRAYVEGST